MAKQSSARPSKPQLTDVERHQRFIETAREIDADDNPASFDRAFASVVTKPKPKSETPEE